MASRSNQFPPKIGTMLAGISSLTAYAGCVLMPLAGRAGSATPHAAANRLALTAVWTAGVLAGVGALKMCGSKGRAGKGPAALAAVQALLLVLLWTGSLGR